MANTRSKVIYSINNSKVSDADSKMGSNGEIVVETKVSCIDKSYQHEVRKAFNKMVANGKGDSYDIKDVIPYRNNVRELTIGDLIKQKAKEKGIRFPNVGSNNKPLRKAA